MNDYFCIVPFFGQEINKNQINPVRCCLMSADANLDSVRSNMLQGLKPKECSKCWTIEKAGFESNRLIMNRTYDFYADKDIRIVEEECKQGKYSDQVLKIYTSKLCNSTCVTCDPDHSTAWASLRKIKINKTHNISDSTVKNIDYKELKILSFVGGEPLYENKNFDILQNLLDNKNQNCFISFVTNGSVELSDKKIQLLSQFKNLNICVSIDGIDSKFNYIRYPLRWDTLKENIKTFKSLQIDLSVSYTISNLNILYYQETVNWFKKNDLKFNHNIVSKPSHFSINSLPQKVKSSLSPAANTLLNPHTINDDLQFQKFIKEIVTQDKLKNISIEDYMPEMAKIIKENI